MDLKKKAIELISHNYDYCMKNCEVAENLFETIDLLKEQLKSRDEQIAVFHKLIYLLEHTSYSFRSIRQLGNMRCLMMGTSSQRPHYIATDFYIYQGMQLSTVPDGKMFIRHEEEYLFVIDIQTEIDRGLGTLLMKELFKYARDNKVYLIVGNLEQHDLKNHGDRLLHFYNKFGFVITDLEHGRKYIELKL